MWTDLLTEQMETGHAAILQAAHGADRIEAERMVLDFLMRAGPGDGPGNRENRAPWHIGSSALDDDTGSVIGYTTSLAWTTAGVVTSAAVYVSTTGSVHSTTLGARAVPRHEVAGSDTPQDESVRTVGWSVPADERSDLDGRAFEDRGYHLVPARSQVLALLDVAEGRAAGFVGRVADPAARLATSLLISEAHGQVSDWSGGYPGPDDDSVVAGSHFTHYQSLARILAAGHRAAAPATGRQGARGDA